MEAILKELKEIKNVLAQLTGSSDLPKKEQFSKAALAEAAKAFRKLSMERGEWIADDRIGSIIKNAPYRAADFIIKEFGFLNYFKQGRKFYLNKKDLQALNKELKRRNIELQRYVEYRQDQARFKTCMASLKENNKGKGKKAFVVPDMYDITSPPPKAPEAAIIRKDIERLKEEFFEGKLNDYVDIYGGNHAMIKSIYWYEKYLEPGTKRKCQRWCDRFNYANHALELITNKKEPFIPVKEEDMIQL